MIIEQIYEKVYADSEKVADDDLTMSEGMGVLLEETNMDTLDKEKLGLLLCKAGLIGQKQGFIRGFRFVVQMIAEAVL